eukprot:1159348-Pelagomonas_calceolata.AAC.11
MPECKEVGHSVQFTGPLRSCACLMLMRSLLHWLIALMRMPEVKEVGAHACAAGEQGDRLWRSAIFCMLAYIQQVVDAR